MTGLIRVIRDAKQELERQTGQVALFMYIQPAVHDALRDEVFAFKEKEGNVNEFRLKSFMGMKVKIDATVPDALGIYLSLHELKLDGPHRRKTDATVA